LFELFFLDIDSQMADRKSSGKREKKQKGAPVSCVGKDLPSGVSERDNAAVLSQRGQPAQGNAPTQGTS
jgi:hypothetical protein